MKSGTRFELTVLLLTVLTLLVGQGCSERSPLDPALTTPGVASSIAPNEQDLWNLAELEQVTAGPDLDLLSRRAMGIDNQGTLHAIYQRGVSSAQGLYYVSRPQGGEWSTPEQIGAPGTYPGPGWLEVRKETGEIYVVFHNLSELVLGIRRAGSWEFHTLETPDEYGVGKPALTVDAAGVAHVAMLVNWDTESGFVVWQIAYGYWDGSSNFHFQLLKNSVVPHHGLFAQPDIVAREDGSVVIAYHQDEDGQFLIRVEENRKLGGKQWAAELVDVPGVIVFPESLERDSENNLHLAFHTNIELGAEHHAYYACRRSGGSFNHTEMVSGSYTGARPRIAFAPDKSPHLVFEETLGAGSTGRIIHAYKTKGQWAQEVVVDGGTVIPSFVIDSEGNGSLLFERRVIQMEDHDINYFGFVAPVE